MTHKLARILWHRIRYKEPFQPEVFAPAEAKLKRQKLARLQTLATSLNYQLVPPNHESQELTCLVSYEDMLITNAMRLNWRNSAALFARDALPHVLHAIR